MQEKELIDLFLEEAAENLQAVEEGLLALEKNPGDKELINLIFRAIHTIKGGAGMVGLEGVSFLAHRLENLLAEMRRRPGGGEGEEELNLLFSGTDLLKQLLRKGEAAAMSSGGELDRILEMLEQYENGEDSGEAGEESSLLAFAGGVAQDEIQEMAEAGQAFYRISVELGRGCMLKSVRAYMVLKAVRERAKIMKVDPPPLELERENFAYSFSVLAAGAPGDAGLQKAIAAISEVERVEVFSVSAEEASKLLAEEGDQERAPRPAPSRDGRGSRIHYYRINLEFDPHILHMGIDPLMFLVELAESGRILESYANISQLPPFEELDPELFYLKWTLFYETPRRREEVEELFVFVQGHCAVTVEEITAELDCWFQGDKKTGELLVERGLISPEELKEALDRQKRIGELLVEEGKLSGGQVEKVLQVQQQFRDHEQAHTVRVDTAKLESILDHVAELLMAQSRVKEMALAAKESNRLKAAELLNAFQEVDKIIRRLQEDAMNASMVPIAGTFLRFQRMARDLAKKMGKEVDVVISGRETEVDKKVIEQIADPLKHLLRNSVDHGLEPPQERAALGKPPRGTIFLNAFHQEGSIVIEIGDDGRGIDEEAVLARAKELGLVEEGLSLSREAVQRLLFAPGFSTAREVSDLSGRGVGLDVVMANVRSLRGTVSVSAEKGRGTKFTIKLPLTLAIIDGMLIRVGEERFIIPLTSINEFIKAAPGDVRLAEGKGQIMHLRQEYIPYACLYQLLQVEPDCTEPEAGIVVILREGGKKMALLVDEIIGQEQVVVKSIKEHVEQASGMAGATIMGDGRVAVILDTASLFRLARQRKEGPGRPAAAFSGGHSAPLPAGRLPV